MKLWTSLLLLGSTTLLFTACGKSSIEEPMTAYDGKYDMNVYSKTSVNKFGVPCCDYEGEMAVTNANVLGVLIVPPALLGKILTVSGDVEANGVINGNFASDGADVAIYKGKLDGVVGSGTWKDTLECSGTWEIAPQ